MVSVQQQIYTMQKRYIHEQVQSSVQSKYKPNETRVYGITQLNPESFTNSQSTTTSHSNPILQNKKPFLSQVKQRAINPQQFRTEKRADQVEKASTASNMYADQVIYPTNQERKGSITAYQKGSTQTQANSRTSSKEKVVNAVSASPVQEDLHKILKEQNRFLRQKSQALNQDLKKELQKTFQKDKDLRQKNRFIDQLRQEIDRLKGLEADSHRIHSEFDSLLLQSQQNDHNSSQAYNQLLSHCNQLQNILHQKDEYLAHSIQNKTNEHISAINFKNNEIKALQQRVQILQRENSHLNQQVREVRELLQNNNRKETNFSANKFENISKQFESSVNTQIDEISRLKNIVGQQEGKIDELTIQNNSLSTFILALEQRQTMNSGSKMQSELDYFRERLQRQQQQHDQLISRKDLQILRLQNDLSARRYQQTGSLLDFTDKQKLTQNFQGLLAEVDKLRVKVSSNRS